MKEFIKPYMIKCNPDLILRFWRSRGRPGKLTLVIYGVRLSYVMTIFGELIIKLPWKEEENETRRRKHL
jgi:hypothetical protein